MPQGTESVRGMSARIDPSIYHHDLPIGTVIVASRTGHRYRIQSMLDNRASMERVTKSNKRDMRQPTGFSCLLTLGEWAVESKPEHSDE